MIGLTKYGVANVSSTTNVILCLWAIFATDSISTTSELGFPNVSIYKAFVFSLIALSTSSSLKISTKFVSIPYWGKVCSNKLNEPPYTFLAETILSLFWAKFNIVYVTAAAPDATANAATPPSRAAIRFSNTSSVGFV